MSFALRARASVDRVARHFGDGATITLRRNHTLANGRTGAKITALEVNGTVAIGGTSVNLDAAGLDPGGLLPVGITLTHDGNTYTVATANVRVNSSGVLSGVAITPALVSEATDGDAMTIATTYKDYTLTAARRHFFEDETTENITTKDWRFLVSAVGASVEFNTETDAAIFDGQELNVVSVEPYEPGTVRAGLILAVAA